MKKGINFFKNRSFYAVFLSVVISVVLVAGAAGAATTISANINTGGTLDVTGATTLSSTLTVTGATTLNGNITLGSDDADVLTINAVASTTANFQVGTDVSAPSDLFISGMATTTGLSGDIATQGTLTVGGDVSGTAVDRIFAGVCNFAATVTINASTTGYVICENATGITETDRVLVMATSSLPENFMIQSASSTPTNGAISVLIYNTGQVAGDATGVRSLNYWAFR